MLHADRCHFIPQICEEQVVYIFKYELTDFLHTLAFAPINLVGGAIESRKADARPVVDFSDAAVASWQCLALADVHLTVDVDKTALTFIRIAVYDFVTGDVILTSCAATFIKLNKGKQLARKSGSAAAVPVFTNWNYINFHHLRSMSHQRSELLHTSTGFSHG